MAPRTPKDPSEKPAKTKPVGRAPVKTKPARPALSVVETPAPATKAAALKLKDLIDQVAAATSLKKPDAKKAVEATLSALQAALAAGNELAVPPLGKLRVAKTSGAVMTLKLRAIKGEKAAAKPLADSGEDD